MSGRRLIIVGGILVVLIISLGALYFLNRPEPSDEQRIHRLVAQAQEAVERRNSTGLTRLISQDYYDRSGTTRRQLVAMIVQWMRGGEQLVVVPEVANLKINDAFADVDLRVRLWRGREPSGAGQEYLMTARLRKEGREWKVISAEGWAQAQSDLMGGD